MQAKQLSDVWLKASVLGSLWAASEIILGSFLHTMHIPLKGSLLTGIGLILMISASYRWNDKGLFWRSGVICALMKALSPSAVIFGPMVAIFMEAVMFETGVRLLGRNTAGFITGSVLAMTWVIIQKLLNLLLYYGANLVEIYKGIVAFISRQLNISNQLTWEPVLVLAAIYLVTGIISAVAGMYIGRKALHSTPDRSLKPKEAADKQPGGKPANFEYSVAWLFATIAAVAAGLTAINLLPYYVWVPAIIFLITLWVWRYKRAMRQLLKPRFWISFTVITLLAAFTLSFLSQDGTLMSGLLTGMQMNFRAALIVMGFSVVGTELYNPAFKQFFSHGRFTSATAALRMAFESLPLFIANIPDARSLLRNPSAAIGRLLYLAEVRFAEIRKPLSLIELITGPVASGKTTYIISQIEKYRSQGIVCGGFYAIRIMQGDQTIGYDLVSAATGQAMPFLRLAGAGTSPDIGRYSIKPEAVKFGESLLKQSSGAEVIVLDEIGKLELAGKGWYNALRGLSTAGARRILVGARQEVATEVEAMINGIVKPNPRSE